MYTSLHLAAESGKTDTVEALIKHGAKIHEKTPWVSYIEMMICFFDLLLLTFVNFYFVFIFCFVIFISML